MVQRWQSVNYAAMLGAPVKCKQEESVAGTGPTRENRGQRPNAATMNAPNMPYKEESASGMVQR